MMLGPAPSMSLILTMSHNNLPMHPPLRWHWLLLLIHSVQKLWVASVYACQKKSLNHYKQIPRVSFL